MHVLNEYLPYFAWRNRPLSMEGGAAWILKGSDFHFVALGWHTMIHKVSCCLRPYNAVVAITFYKAAFNAIVIAPVRVVRHKYIAPAELSIGPATFIVSDFGRGNAKPKSTGRVSRVTFNLQVENIYATIDHAANAGATILQYTAQLNSDELFAIILDPFGYEWFIREIRESTKIAELETQANTICESTSLKKGMSKAPDELRSLLDAIAEGGVPDDFLSPAERNQMEVPRDPFD